jgi:hypothetical protein
VAAGSLARRRYFVQVLLGSLVLIGAVLLIAVLTIAAIALAGR